jgi:hypothetical protein
VLTFNTVKKILKDNNWALVTGAVEDAVQLIALNWDADTSLISKNVDQVIVKALVEVDQNKILTCSNLPEEFLASLAAIFPEYSKKCKSEGFALLLLLGDKKETLTFKEFEDCKQEELAVSIVKNAVLYSFFLSKTDENGKNLVNEVLGRLEISDFSESEAAQLTELLTKNPQKCSKLKGFSEVNEVLLPHLTEKCVSFIGEGESIQKIIEGVADLNKLPVFFFQSLKTDDWKSLKSSIPSIDADTLKKGLKKSSGDHKSHPCSFLTTEASFKGGVDIKKICADLGWKAEEKKQEEKSDSSGSLIAASFFGGIILLVL